MNSSSNKARGAELIEENRMTLSIGEKVSLPSHGPCVIGAVVNKLVGGTSTAFYRLAPLDDNGGELFIPVDKITGLGIRQLLQKSEIPKLLGRLSQPGGKVVPPPSTARNWKQRALDNGKLLSSGAASDLVQIVESLSDLNETKTLAPHERQTLERAKKLLVCEITEVLGEPRNAVEEQLEKALQARKAG
jgi:CarD family transcriptional regulator